MMTVNGAPRKFIRMLITIARLLGASSSYQRGLLDVTAGSTDPASPFVLSYIEATPELL